ncbi:MAG: hypothetical protein JWM33_2930 [Caulobacteraceae bacterium]|nr:hypothetical protein [Caulobacteraceae bacterium]
MTPERKRRIALVVPAFGDMGGVPIVALFIARAIAQRPDLEALFISLSMSARDPCSLLLHDPRTWLAGVRTRKARFQGQDYIHVGAQFGEIEIQRLSRRARLTQLLKDCDLIQVVAGTPAWGLTVAELGKPVVLQVATLTQIERRAQLAGGRGLLGLYRQLMTRLVATMDERALAKMDAVLVENNWMLAHSKARVSPDCQLVFAPPGVDTCCFRPGRHDEAGPPGRPYILTVGRMADPRKQAGLLLDAYRRLVEVEPDAPDLVLAGADGPPQGFWRQVDAWGLAGRVRMELSPSLDALAALYRHAACFALASDEEGFGVVVIEAMASGLAVVSTRSGGPDDIITEGVDGYLVDRGSAEGLAQALGRLVANPQAARAMGAAGRAKVEALYSDQAAGARYLEVYDRLLGVVTP